MAEEQEISPVTYEELAQIEDEFDEIDSEISMSRCPTQPRFAP